MSEEQEPLRIAHLEKKGALQILLFLYEWEDSKNPTISDITNAVQASRETVLSTVDLLKMLRLAEDFVDQQFPFGHTVWLTELGKKAAEALVTIDQSLKRSQHQEDNSTA